MTETAPRADRRAWWAAAVAGMASYLDGAALLGTGSVLVLYQDEFDLSGDQIGLLSGLITAFFAIGALIGGRLGDRFGRRRVFTVTMLVVLAGAILLAAAVDPVMIYAGVVLLGLGVGADLPVSLAMIAESAPRGMVGRMITFSQYLWLAGMLAVVAIGVLAGGLGTLGGRIYGIHVVVIAALVLLLRLRLPESRTWTETHAVDITQQTTATLRDLFRSEYRWPLIGTGLFYTLLMVALNTNGQFTTYMWVNVAGSTVQVSSMFQLGLMAVTFIGTTLLLRIVDSRWRTRAFIIASVVNVAGFLVPAVFGVTVPALVVFGVLFALGGAIAGEPMYKVWSQELMPTHYRATAQGITMFVARMVGAVVAVFVPALLAAGAQGLFAFLATITAASCLVGILWLSRLPKVIDTEGAPVVERDAASAADASATPTDDARV